MRAASAVAGRRSRRSLASLRPRLGLLGLLALAGCDPYDPSPPGGQPCSETDQCPAGQQCDPEARICRPHGDPASDALGPGDDAGGHPADGGAVDAPALLDAASDAAPCVTACISDLELRDCDGGGGSIVDCPLGCLDSGGPHCAALVPSNGASTADLAGVSPLAIGDGVASLDADTGAITLAGGALLRPPGQGLAGGLRFTLLGSSISVLAADSVDIAPGATLRVSGDRALILLARGAVQIAGTIELAVGCPDGRRICAGPGGGDGGDGDSADGEGCGPGMRGWHDNVDTGGGGGAMGQDGASGGDGPSEAGGAGGDASACPGPTLVPLRGGSGGGAGGDGHGGRGGGGGGALQITSLTAILIAIGPDPTIEPTIYAGGAGGEGDDNSEGGGGGGAGGAILLEAPAIGLEGAILAANGGGGGDGDDWSDSDPGANGGLGTTPAPGGGPGSIGAGGNGGSAQAAPTQGADGQHGQGGHGAGGGGGAAGILRFIVPASDLSLDSDTILSPAPSRADPLVQ